MKKQLLSNFKSVLISSIVSFFAYLLSVVFLAALWENSANRFLYMYCVIAIIYSICFYRFHMSNRIDTFATHGEKYNFIQETKAYLKEDGKFLIIIYGICAIVCEISYLIIYLSNMPTEQNFVFILCLWFFPFIASIKIPILRSVVSLLLASAIAILVANIRSYVIFKDNKRMKVK